MARLNDDTLLDAIFGVVRELLAPHEKSGHGPKHIQWVWNKIEEVIVGEDSLTPQQKLCIRLAGILHEADDHKLFPESTNNSNARKILAQFNLEPENVDLVIEMINLVSCSANGNNIPDGCPLWKLIPRDVDRVEALGRIGLIRCYKVTKERGNRLFNENTPRATTLEELYQIATPERFAQYTKTGKSDTMVDHLYDKILHLKPQSGYGGLEKLFSEGKREVEEYLLQFGLTGFVQVFAE